MIIGTDGMTRALITVASGSKLPRIVRYGKFCTIFYTHPEHTAGAIEGGVEIDNGISEKGSCGFQVHYIQACVIKDS
jgi:hypothetical protein